MIGCTQKNDNNSSDINHLGKEEEFIKHIKKFTSSMIYFNVIIEKEIVSLDNLQRDEIKKNSEEYFTSLLKISKIPDLTNYQSINPNKENNNFQSQSLSKERIDLINEIDQIIISLYNMKIKMQIILGKFSSHNDDYLKKKLEDFQKFIKETINGESLITNFNNDHPSSNISVLAKKVKEMKFNLGKKFDECQDSMMNLNSKINILLEKKSEDSKIKYYQMNNIKLIDKQNNNKFEFQQNKDNQGLISFNNKNQNDEKINNQKLKENEDENLTRDKNINIRNYNSSNENNKTNVQDNKSLKEIKKIKKLDDFIDEVLKKENITIENLDFIPTDRIKEIKKLGEGGFGEVWEGRLNTYTPIGIKKLLKTMNEDSWLQIFKEVYLMNKVKHPKLIHFYGFWKDENKNICLIMDLMNGKDLSYLIHESPIKLSMVQRFEILKDIAEGINQFHSKKIVHRDIKCSNVLISEIIQNTNQNLKAKLSDYGESIELNILSKKITEFKEKNILEYDNNCLWSEYNGTIQYAPPEILEGDITKLTEQADIYSFGTIIYEIFTNKIPYQEYRVDGFSLSLKIIADKIKPDLSNFIENTPCKEIDSLIQRCWEDDAEKRPIINDIIDEIIDIQKKHNFTNEYASIHNKIEEKSYAFDEYKNLYVLPKGGLNDTTKETFPLLNYVITEFLNKQESKSLLILGRSGSGKSLFTKFLQDYLLSQHLDILPFRTDLNSLENPYKTMIPEVLSKYNLKDDEFEKIKYKRMLFILDGFDEINGKENIYDLNNLMNFPKAKLIISCRDEYLSSKYVKDNFNKIFFPLKERKNFKQVHLRNFEVDEIKSYIKNYLAIKKNDHVIKNFKETLKKSNQIEDTFDKFNLIKTTFEDFYINIVIELNKSLPILNSPFLLNLICGIIPTNEVFQDSSNFKSLKRLTIYQLFLNIIFYNEYQRRNLDRKDLIKFKDLIEHLKVKEMMRFSEDLACDLFISNNRYEEKEGFFKANYIYKDLNNPKNVFNKYFKEDSKTKFFFKSTLLKEIEIGKWNFTHKSIKECFVSLRIIKEIKSLNNKCLVDEYLLKSLIINNSNLSESPSILWFLVDYLKLNGNFEGKLWKYINLTKKTREDKIDMLASNCMTILNYSGVILFGKKYSDIRIPYADLRECNLNNCIFTNTHMKKCNLNNSNFENSEFYNSDLENVYIGKKQLKFESEIKTIGFSHNNKYFVVALKNSVIIYNVIDGFKQIKKIEDQEEEILSSISFSTDGLYLASGSSDKSVKIYDIESNFNQIKKLENHDKVNSISFSADGKYLASLCLYAVTIYDLQNGFNQIKILEVNNYEVKSISFSPDGKYFASGGEIKNEKISIIIYDVHNGFYENRKIKYHNMVISICFSPNGRYFSSGSFDNSVIIYDVENSFNEIKKLQDHGGPILSLSFSTDGRFFASGSYDNSSIIYDVLNRFKKIKMIQDHFNLVISISFSSDGKYFTTGSWDKLINIYDIQNGFYPIKKNEDHQKSISSISFSADGKYLASGGYDKSVIIYEVLNGFNQTYKLRDHLDVISSTSFSVDKKHFASGSWDNTVIIYDTQNRFNQIKKLEFHEGRVISISFSADGKYFASGSYDSSIIIYEVQNGFKQIKKLQNEDRVSSIAFSCDGRYFASAIVDWSVIIYDIKNEFDQIKIIDHEFEVSSISFSSDGRYLATGGGFKSVILYEIKNDFYKIKELKNHRHSISFSNDGRYLASGSNYKSVIVYDLENDFKQIKILRNDKNDCSTISFSPDGRYFASEGWKKSIIIYEIQNRFNKFKTCKDLDNQSSSTSYLSYSSDARYNSSGNIDSSIIEKENFISFSPLITINNISNAFNITASIFNNCNYSNDSELGHFINNRML